MIWDLEERSWEYLERGRLMKDKAIKFPDGWEYKDNFEEVFLNKYG